MVLSKRECAALCSARLGFTALLERMPKQPLLMVLNYHRIGDPEQTPTIRAPSQRLPKSSTARSPALSAASLSRPWRKQSRSRQEEPGLAALVC